MHYASRGKKFAKGNAFIGYQNDTPAAVVFQASNFLRRLREEENSIVVENKLEVLHRAGILNKMSFSVFLNRDDISDQWQEAVCFIYIYIYIIIIHFLFHRYFLSVSFYSYGQLHQML